MPSPCLREGLAATRARGDGANDRRLMPSLPTVARKACRLRGWVRVRAVRPRKPPPSRAQDFRRRPRHHPSNEMQAGWQTRRSPMDRPRKVRRFVKARSASGARSCAIKCAVESVLEDTPFSDSDPLARLEGTPEICGNQTCLPSPIVREQSVHPKSPPPGSPRSVWLKHTFRCTRHDVPASPTLEKSIR